MKKTKKRVRARVRTPSAAERLEQREAFRHRMHIRRRQEQEQQAERFMKIVEGMALHSERQAVAFERLANAIEKMIAD